MRIGVNKLPKVVIWQYSSRKTNSQSSVYKSNNPIVSTSCCSTNSNRTHHCWHLVNNWLTLDISYTSQWIGKNTCASIASIGCEKRDVGGGGRQRWVRKGSTATSTQALASRGQVGLNHRKLSRSLAGPRNCAWKQQFTDLPAKQPADRIISGFNF